MIEALANDHGVIELAEALEVAQSGFHAHRRKDRRPRRRQDALLGPLLAQAFVQSRRTYGSPRLRIALREQGHRCGKNRIARLMRQAGLRAKQKRRFRPRTTDSGHPYKIAPNLLAKVAAPQAPNQIWQSDISYIQTKEGWLYFAFTIDAFTRKIVAHHCREDLGSELATTTLTRALQRQRPLEGLIHHSDRGVQYASHQFRDLLKEHHLTASMSRGGNPYDNALAESFVATLKTECLDSIPSTKDAAKLIIFDYIETFYNPHRKHTALNFLSPLHFEILFSKTNKHLKCQ